MVLRFILQSYHWNLTLYLFHIQTPLQSNQLMTMKWTIYWNYSTKNIMVIFWMLNSICFRLYCWMPFLQNFIQSLLCCFIKTKELMFQSQIICHNFLCLSQPRPPKNWLMKKRDMPKELGLFYVFFLTVPLYIQWYQFIIFHITLPIPSHRVPSNFMLVFKILHLNLLNIVTFLTLKVVLGYHPTRLATI